MPRATTRRGRRPGGAPAGSIRRGPTGAGPGSRCRTRGDLGGRLLAPTRRAGTGIAEARCAGRGGRRRPAVSDASAVDSVSLRRQLVAPADSSRVGEHLRQAGDAGHAGSEIGRQRGLGGVDAALAAVDLDRGQRGRECRLDLGGRPLGRHVEAVGRDSGDGQVLAGQPPADLGHRGLGRRETGAELLRRQVAAPQRIARRGHGEREGVGAGLIPQEQVHLDLHPLVGRHGGGRDDADREQGHAADESHPGSIGGAGAGLVQRRDEHGYGQGHRTQDDQ